MSAPEQGALVYLDFNPQAEHEQAGRRPVIVLSPYSFNNVTGLASVCPITNTARGWGFEEPLPDGLVFEGVILTDQIKKLDWTVRNIQLKGYADSQTVQNCLNKIHIFL
ncbi:type II toxin-antitoxin system PemK/MazF family toxin [Pontibacillus marinus]|uniref:Potassium-transporting ATPase subunit C n=1 Tax=Pontibacillus marinus BH030004 = DSM 16465 TaxID=1385511 RepID=A0A0A5I7B4_9BACI|nr:type II toxin-antitoxin system PemK/MazF family toxin [Pontibacillus marinus]KGX91727.1 potassium-transporting ATPase subunit C [Pontibacillus marinus BH030004 = DSM 16465]